MQQTCLSLFVGGARGQRRVYNVYDRVVGDRGDIVI